MCRRQEAHRSRHSIPTMLYFSLLPQSLVYIYPFLKNGENWNKANRLRFSHGRVSPDSNGYNRHGGWSLPGLRSNAPKIGVARSRVHGVFGGFWKYARHPLCFSKNGLLINSISRIIAVVFRQCPNTVQMIRHNDNSVHIKRFALFYISKGIAQFINFIDQ